MFSKQFSIICNHKLDIINGACIYIDTKSTKDAGKRQYFLILYCSPASLVLDICPSFTKTL